MHNKGPQFSRLYKFLNRSFVDGMLKRGTVRIGTAREYREPDGKIGARSDPEELITAWRPATDKISVGADHPFIKSIFGRTPDWPPGKKLDMVFAPGAGFNFMANCLIYSTSWEITDAMKKRMAKDFDADACVRIDNVAGFMGVLSGHEFLKGRPSDIGRVRYVNSNITTEFRSDNAYSKLANFGWQKEVRLIWAGEPQPEKGEVIEIPDATRFLTWMY